MPITEVIQVSQNEYALVPLLFGPLDIHMKKVENALDVRINMRDDEIYILGNQAQSAKKVLLYLMECIRAGETIEEQKILYTLQMFNRGEGTKLKALTQSYICITSRGKYVKPKTLGQETYVRAIEKHDVVFGIGPAGTGKTFIAVAMAIKAFKNHEVNRIVITRPAVEAGENLGFLPGDLQMKVDPYLRPLYDALYDILGMETFNAFKEKGLIEIAPLAYMRGRTLDHAFIILDEAQNTTKEQMKMFLTRLGFGSKVVVNGDITQIDLPVGKKSGLIHAMDVLKEIKEIEMVHFSTQDVVRHELVKKIIEQYNRFDEAQRKEVPLEKKQEKIVKK